jgi:hypothetical protein
VAVVSPPELRDKVKAELARALCIPYQTLISGIIHRYVEGDLVSKDGQQTIAENASRRRRIRRWARNLMASARLSGEVLDFRIGRYRHSEATADGSRRGGEIRAVHVVSGHLDVQIKRA